MTENECIETLKLNRPFAYSELQNAIDIAIQAIEEIQQYRKNIKNKHIGKDNMVISSSDLMTILNNDSEENKEGYKHGYSDGYAKGIDEFAERLKGKAEEILKNPDIVAECKKCTIWTVKDIDEISEQLKKGGAI